ncbi:sugar ABC transporter permease [Paenibacillus marchantiophytorum]|uniref:Sugar ABC transporter permease n=1 Tax=Paenibacillus marchantiophytorum TaxID=1619310 RepID=A0ABQ1EXA3_9BACL|nr:sugar ABC transporter permease [Paenibacillus marchantiophytorum]GFZ91632.1 sugar ABC transporter permease [Paenibacillus marchantiophytorum]
MHMNKLYSRLFVIPAIVLYTLFFIIPVAGGLYYSFTDWNMMRPDIGFVGLDNYKEIFSSTGPYMKSIIHTFSFTFFTVIFKVLIGLFLAILLNEGLRTRNLLRMVFFLPYTLSPLIIGIIFVSILGPQGPINVILKFIGLGDFTRSWLTDKSVVLASTMGVEVWRMVGWNMVILLAGLQTISKSYYEAASLDGANKWQQFISITLPFLTPALTIAIILNTIHGLRVFEIIYALTNGGPGNLTEVINTQIFKEFSIGRYGMSNALGIIAFLITLIIAFIMKKVVADEEADA